MNDAAAMLQAVRDGDVSAVKRLLSEDPALVRATDDHLKKLQAEAVKSGKADWGHWGTSPEKYSTWKTHSNRLIPLYAFGFSRATFGALLLVFAFQALFIHANVRLTFGPLRYVVATPEFHCTS